MIVQALHQRYVDLAANPDSGVSPLYFSVGKVSYVLELDRDGTPVNLLDIRDMDGKKLRPRTMMVPEQSARANGINPYFLVDKAEYAIGYFVASASESETAKKAADAGKKHDASQKLARQVLEGLDDEAAIAMLRFYDRWESADVRRHPLLQPYLNELDKGIDTNIAFRLRGSPVFLHETEAIKQAWIKYRQQQDSEAGYEAQCLITGLQNVSIARTHEKVKGVRNAQQAGASLVSFNFQAAVSYDKEQSYNAPVGKTAAFGYTTALNHLLASSRNRMLVGDMTVVFWSGKTAAAEELEPFFASFFEQSQLAEETEDKDLTAQLQSVLMRIRSGDKLDKKMIPYGDTPFYVLGLSPNNARVAVRFFWQGDFGEMVDKLGRHASDFGLKGNDEWREFTPTVYRILAETLRVGGDGKKVGDLPPLLGGEIFRAVLQGAAYPYSMYTSILNRIRTDGIINHLRASILKAYLIRYSRIHCVDKLKEGLTLSLNVEAQEPAYRLGRLFAVLEKAQQEAAGGPNRLNATIKDRYFNAASSNPAAVFPILIKLAQHHIGKAKFGDFRDREMQEILDGVDQFPAHLDLQRQGLFVLGYYHQKQHFFQQIKAATENKQAAMEAESQTAAGGD